ncbi:chemotaxis protein [Lysinibacillus sp. NPDC097287]|uniref:chemotaxis protein n=1 Tax=Lysinibacillus sp. NPDC097287 TaxID=3364144 RepID=UPI003811215C
MDISNSSVQENEQESKLRVLQEVLVGQRDDLSLLCSIIEYLKSHKSVGLDNQDTKKFTEKIQVLKLRQRNRYELIDKEINENLFEIKTGKVDSRLFAGYGKEIRKLESGLRTLILFTCDVIEMMTLGSTVEDRVNDRIYYFDKRSISLENEMLAMQGKVTTIYNN